MTGTQTRTRDDTTPRVTVGFPAADRERLQRLANRHERSLSWVVRHAVHAFLNERDKGQLDLDLSGSGGG